MALELAHSGYNVGGGVPEGGWTLDSFAPAAGMTVARRGARCSSDGILAYSATVSGDYTYSGVATYAGSGLQTLCGRRAPDCFELRVTANGALEINENGSTLAQSATGLVPQDGSPFAWAIEVTTSGVRGVLNGSVVVEDAVAHTIATGTPTQWIGRSYAADPQYWQGALWDFRRVDAAGDASSAYFALDTLNNSGQYENTQASSVVGDITPTGTVLPVRISATTPGSGVPISEGPVVVMASRTTAQTFAGTAGIVALTAAVDPYGWAATGQIDQTVPGLSVVTVTGRIRATALSGADDVEMTITMEGLGHRAYQAITLDTVNEWKPYSITWVGSPVPASGYTTRVLTIAGTTTVEVDDVYLTLTLYPDLS